MRGVLVDHQIEALIAQGQIALAQPLLKGQVQPASLDLRLGPRAYRIQASVLPSQNETVAEAIAPLVMYEFSLEKPRLLERGGIYIVPLLESLNLPPEILASASPKSSTGRLDIFVRLLTDKGETFDTVPAGYSGPLWLEIMPLTFPIMVRQGDRLNQLRLRQGNPVLTDAELQDLNSQTALLQVPDVPKRVVEARIAEGLWISLDLEGLDGARTPESVVGYRAKHHTGSIDLAKVAGYDWRNFWEPITARDCNPLILYPEDFYIFVSREKIVVPAGVSAELVAYDTRVGELRLHYAGFFDPGWGMFEGEARGAHAVLEVRAHDVPCVLRHGQRLGRFVYEHLADQPTQLYGSGIGSNYAGQTLRLAKQFIM